MPTVRANPPGTGGDDCAAEDAALAAAHAATVSAKAAYDNARSIWRYDQDELIELNIQFDALTRLNGPNYAPTEMYMRIQRQ